MHMIKPKDSREDITTQLQNINKVIQALYYKPGASRARIHKLVYKRQRKHQISEYRYETETDKPLERRGKIKHYDRKAQASCLGPSEPTPGRRQARSSNRREGSSSSRSRRQGRLSQGLRHLVATNGYGEKENKATVST